MSSYMKNTKLPEPPPPSRVAPTRRKATLLKEPKSVSRRAPATAAMDPDDSADSAPSIGAAPQLDTSWRDAALQAGSSEHYDDAALYDHEYRRRRDDVKWYRALAHKVSAEERPGEPPLRILELGCGTGRLLGPLVRDGHQVLGVDRSASMLARCGQRLSALGQAARQRGQLLQADFRALPLGDRPAERFPLILCPFNSFMHLYTRDDIEQCLAEVRRLLAPGGLFALDVMNPDPSWLARDEVRRWSRTRFRHPSTGERLVYSTNHTYDSAAQIAWIRIYYEPDPAYENAPAAAPSPPRTVQLTHRQLFPAELEALLHYNGFAITQRSGGFDGQPISPVSAEQVICARAR